MTQIGHTPGPWGHGSLTNEILSNGHAIAMMNPEGEIPEDVSDANARLIAAAPEMLAALKNIAEFAEQQINGCTPYGVSVFADKARAALAKAEGKS